VAVLKALHYSDIVGDFCEQKSVLGLPGTTIDLIDGNSQGWRTVDLSKFANMNLSQFKKSSTATTIFQITRPKIEDIRPKF
jgi:hypothetical protein